MEQALWVIPQLARPHPPFVLGMQLCLLGAGSFGVIQHVHRFGAFEPDEPNEPVEPR